MTLLLNIGSLFLVSSEGMPPLLLDELLLLSNHLLFLISWCCYHVEPLIRLCSVYFPCPLHLTCLSSYSYSRFPLWQGEICLQKRGVFMLGLFFALGHKCPMFMIVSLSGSQNSFCKNMCCSTQNINFCFVSRLAGCYVYSNIDGSSERTGENQGWGVFPNESLSNEVNLWCYGLWKIIIQHLLY